MNTLVQFGPQGQLVGILSAGAAASNAPTLILPNAGLIPRAGPFRLHVELAERLARHGIGTFRFDVPGVGEAARLPGMGDRDATMAAIDHLAANHGCSRFVVGGVCSAADVGWHAALTDDRVVGMLLIDGLSFTGPWFHFGRLVNAIKRGPRGFSGVIARWLGRGGDGVNRRIEIADYREWPDRVQAQEQFTSLVTRQKKSLWIYTGGYSEVFLHPRQFSWSFGKAARDRCTTLRYWPDCDHTFYARAHRNRLLDTVEKWLSGLDSDTGGRP